uniref:Uncharacterized protein n=1 Tax=Rhizophora mucronata TaxID=61149 RepID=A0A2P2J2J2_RHIMU
MAQQKKTIRIQRADLLMQLDKIWPQRVFKQTAIPKPKHVNINHGIGREE